MSFISWLKQWQKQGTRQSYAKPIRSRWTTLYLERLEDRLNPTQIVTSISTAMGPTLGGTSVTIMGSGFMTATEVDFGSSMADFSINNIISDSQITLLSPPGSAGAVDVTVLDSDGPSATSSADLFTYVAAPVVLGLDRTQGPTAGSTLVTISGTNLDNATAVNFGGNPGTIQTNTSTMITVLSPAGLPGTPVDVTISTVGGTSPISSSDLFTYVAAPVINGISPAVGPLGGGTTVTISGTDLTGATEVDFGTSAVTTFTLVDDHTIQVHCPVAQSAGAVDLTVITVGGTSATSAADLFTYVAAPVVFSIDKIQGPTAGSTLITISGTNLDNATAVNFGGTFGVIQTDTSNTITVLSPAGTAGSAVDVTVTTVGGTSATSSTDLFTYVAAPTITSISPALGSLGGSTIVTITGTNLDNATEVDFGLNNPTLFFSSNTSTQIILFSPAGTTAGASVDVRVVTAGGTSAVSANDLFTYEGSPTITSISPATGTAAGGTLVTINGTNFDGATAVKFGAVAVSILSHSDTQITAYSPAGTPASVVNVTVTTASGTSSILAADQFTYTGLPTITSISPSRGPTDGGATVTITGTNLQDVQEVDFGTIMVFGSPEPNAGMIVSSTPTQIVVLTPNGNAGTVDVTVTTTSGVSVLSANDRYTFAVLPSISFLSPTTGPATGGTAVFISGSNLAGATAVHFGTVLAAHFTVIASDTISVTSPAGVVGPVDVTVTTPLGTSTVTTADQFTYNNLPVITSLSPAIGAVGGGTTVTLVGVQLANATAVKFGNVPATIISNTANQIVVSSPAGTAGDVNVTVTTANGTSPADSTDLFTYQGAPTITGISPASGTTAGSTFVTITGTNLTGVTAVKFGATSATQFFAISSTEIDVTTPAGAVGPVDVSVTTPVGTSSLSLADRFTYTLLPTLDYLTPSGGSLAGGTVVTLHGTNFDGATAVHFGTAAATLISVSSKQILVLSPAGAAGTANVTVTTPLGTSAVSSDVSFTYEGTPFITSVNPTSVPSTGGSYVTITGTNLAGVSAVKFGTVAATNFFNLSSTQIEAFSPAGTGTVDVTVTTTAGTSALSALDRLTYVPPPTITALSLSSGPAGGGTTVTITGSGLANATAVNFGQFSGTIVSNSATQIVAVSPANRLGMVDVRVFSELGGTAVTSADQFTYVQGATPPPTITGISPNAISPAGGTTVTITGTNLANATAVTFANIPVTSIVSNTATQIVVISPQVFNFGLQSLNVIVTAPGGVSAITPADQFQFASTLTSAELVTGPQTLLAGQPSGTIQILLLDDQGRPTAAGNGGVTFSLNTSSGGGTFLNLNGTPLTGSSITIPAGANSASFVYSDRTPGNPTLTMTSPGLPTLTQPATVNALATVLHVTNTLDDGGGSLRQAVVAANAAPGSTIVFDAGVTGVINLLTPLPALTASMNLVGPGANLLTVQSSAVNTSLQSGTDYLVTSTTQGSGANAVLQYSLQNISPANRPLSITVTFNWSFHPAVGAPVAESDTETYVVNPGQTVTAISITNPFTPTATVNSATFVAPQGSGNSARGLSVFDVQATVTLTDLTITNPTSTGIFNNGNLTLNRVAVVGNHASGLAPIPPYGEAGGILNLGTLTVLNSLVAKNTVSHALVAAGIDSEAGSVLILNSTISDNTADHTNSTGGIGIYGGSLYLANSTVTGNIANDTNTSGGGIDAFNSGNVTIFNTIVAGNTGATRNLGDVAGSFTSLGHNLIGSLNNNQAQGFGASGDQLGTTATPLLAKLDPILKNNGGPTSTHALLTGSPAINAGDNTNAPATDQRGLARIISGTIDIGAFEYHLPPLSVQSAATAIFTVGQANHFTVSSTPNNSGAFAALSVSGNFPAGVTFTDNGDGTATLSGTANPAAPNPGIFIFTINGALGGSQVFSQTFSLSVIDPPVITTGNSATFTVGQAASFPISATPGVPTTTTFAIKNGTLPLGLTLTATGNGSAKISGTPSANTGGVYAFTLVASNSSVQTTQPFTLTVTQAPSFTSLAAATFTVGQLGSFTVTTKGTPNATLTKTGALPSGFSFVDNGNGTATLSGTPAAGSASATSISFTINASNGIGQAASQSFKLTISQAPSITSTNFASFVLGKSSSFTITTTPGVPATTTITKIGTLPAGITLSTTVNGSATLSGTPTGPAGTTTFTLVASNGSVQTTQPFTLTVQQAPSFTSLAAATFTAGQFGSFTVTTKGTPSATLSESASLPNGLFFVDNGNGTATLSGIPSAGAVVSFTINASNGVAPAASQTFKLTVNQAPVITTGNTATFTVGQATSFPISATPGVPTTTTFTIKNGTLPLGLKLTATGNGSATISGTPSANTGGVYSFTLVASNSSVQTSMPFTLTVQQAPSFTSLATTSFAAGQFNSFTVTTKGTPSATLSIVGLPNGFSFIDNGNGTATLSGSPASGSASVTPLSFTINASDGIAPAASQSFKLTISQAPVFTTDNSATFTVGQTGTSFLIAATPGLPTTTTFTIKNGTLPLGLTLTAISNNNAKISGTPSANTGGVYSFNLVASNGSVQTSQVFTLTVKQAPVITSASTTAFTLNQLGSFTVTTKGIPTATLNTVGLPNGFSFIDNGNGTATLSGTPTSLTAVNFTINASNGIAPAASQSFKLTINQPPSITSLNAANFALGQKGSFTITTTPGVPTATTITKIGTLPAGITLSATVNGSATLSGTPTGATGATTFTLVASNGTVQSTQVFTLTVNQLPAITSLASTSFTVGQPGAFTITTKAGFPTATTLSESGALPPGVSFSDNGNGTASLSGTPQYGAGGIYTLVVTAGNGATSVTQTLKLTVNQPPFITSANHVTFSVNQPGSFTITTTGFPVGAITESGALPTGVTLVANKTNGTAVLSGKPTVPGTYTFTITASNGLLQDMTQTFVLTVS